MLGWLAWIPWHVWLWLGVPLVALGAAWWFFTDQVKTALGKVPARAWIALIVCGLAIGYHIYAVAAARSEATANADAFWKAQIATAKATAEADHKALQAKIDAMAQPSNDELHAQFSQLQATLDDMKKHPNQYAVPKPVKPLPADCKLDPAVVAAANEVLRQ